ncbi:hypothetical protein B0J18DRAFT_430685 [Chaetomium sp. MPI-SDFR-AT-0129]|nr:hypothetical protein B0J18DRAFT_430685 [Chaetomium sp. MPI-SDFR-AT-0129]
MLLNFGLTWRAGAGQLASWPFLHCSLVALTGLSSRTTTYRVFHLGRDHLSGMGGKSCIAPSTFFTLCMICQRVFGRHGTPHLDGKAVSISRNFRLGRERVN